MREICEDLKANVREVIEEWERLVRQEPWFSLPRDHRINNLPRVVVELAEAALCAPEKPEAHRAKILAAAEHGHHRREQGIPDALIPTEYHLLRQALWYYLVRAHGPTDRTVQAIMKIDSALTTATNASMWGYYRAEVEAMNKWEESIERLIASSRVAMGRREEGKGEA